MPISKIDIYSFPRINLSRYNTMVMVSGNYGALDKSSVSKIKAFVTNGGTLITSKGAS